jgi:hypothetical protein
MNTCKEFLDDMTNVTVEAGLGLCESMSEIKSLCCLPLAPLTPSLALGGAASSSGFVRFTFVSIVSTVCVFARMYDTLNCDF